MRCVRLLTSFVAFASLAGCGEPAEAPQQPAAAPVEVETVDADAPTRETFPPPGEYRLAGADGAEVNLPHAITVSITASEIALASQCVTPRWTWRREDGAVATEPVPEPICERGRYPAEEAAIAVFDDPQATQHTPENGWFIEGGGHSLTLFSQ